MDGYNLTTLGSSVPITVNTASLLSSVIFPLRITDTARSADVSDAVLSQDDDCEMTGCSCEVGEAGTDAGAGEAGDDEDGSNTAGG